MPRKVLPLTDVEIKNARPGRYADGGGLYLLVRTRVQRAVDDDVGSAEPRRGRRRKHLSDNVKFWLFRYTPKSGKLREMGLGAYGSGAGEVSLASARAKARDLLEKVRAGIDPLDERLAKEVAEKAAAQEAKIFGITFEGAAARYIAAHKAGWRNTKHAAQWVATLDEYVKPVFGNIPVKDVDTACVLAALTPIWSRKPETASRVRGRIEAILDYAKVQGWRSGENPAVWRGHLALTLPRRSKIAPVKHHAALPWGEVPAFMERLTSQSGVSALALRFAILTAARTSEVIGARWSEINLSSERWTIPAARMKAGREHVVPLSSAALALLRTMTELRVIDASDAPVFPSQVPTRSLSNMALLALLRRMERHDLTAHGFRSTFRDWVAENTSYPSEVAEMALAHTIGDKVEAAYRRGDLLEKRRRLMEEWGNYCVAPTADRADVVRAIRARSAA